MNKELVIFGKQKLKEGLNLLTPEHHLIFKRMYHHKDLTVSIEQAIDEMDESKIDWALTQVQRSVDKLNKGAMRGTPR